VRWSRLPFLPPALCQLPDDLRQRQGGLKPELADASALAEFLERLQCRADAIFTRAGNIHRLAPFAPTAVRTLGEVDGAAPALVARELGGFTDDTPGGLVSIPFVDVFGRRVVDLPFEIFTMMTGSSGRCAGTTLEEATIGGTSAFMPGRPSFP